MLKGPSLRRVLATAALLGGALFPAARAAQAQLDPAMDLHYYGGPLIQHVKVTNLFWGPYWASVAPEVSYFNNFFQALFADGHYMANLAEYSAGKYKIGNGTWAGSLVDSRALPNPKQITDAQIRLEIAAQIDAGKLPVPDADTLYCVFTPPDVVVVDGDSSSDYFEGYHRNGLDNWNRRYFYAVIVGRSEANPKTGAPLITKGVMTSTCSHELAEAVTDPLLEKLGWADLNYGEIGDLVVEAFADVDLVYDLLVGPNGARYWVQKFWSNKDGGPVGLDSPAASTPTPPATTPGRPTHGPARGPSF